MSGQQGDWIEDAPYQKHSDTSHRAAQEIESSLGALRTKVLQAIRSADSFGATDEELQAQLHMNPSTERPRRIELVKLGLVRDSQQRRLTRSRRRAVIWVAV